MIRILHYGLSSNLGGIETYLYKLYSSIDRNKFEFDFLVTGNKKPCWYDEFTSMGSKFFHVTSRSRNPLRNRMEISKILKNKNFDIVHCHLNSLSYTVPVHLALKHDYPVIVHSRNAGILKSKISRSLHKMNGIFLPQHRINMLAVSNVAGTWMFGKNAKFKVINNGLNVENYKYNSVARDKIREEFGLKQEKVIVHVGAMREQKNHMFLLEVFVKVLEKKSNTRLLLVGDGDLKEQILKKIDELKIKNHVIITGNRKDVPDILSASDVLLFPSFYEGFPNAVLEAQASGLPCLISDVITNEVKVNNNCLSLSLKKSSTEWAEQLLLLQNFDERSMGAYNVTASGLSVEGEIGKIEKTYRDIVNNDC
ncbi:MAG: glycosyltransferase [Eubacteriales bacterium]